MGFEVKKAKLQRRPLKIGLEGLSGSGKTFTALRLAFAMRRAGIGKRVVVADSENESAGLYDGISIDGETWVYDTCDIPAEKQNPAGYTEAYEYLVGVGYDLVIVDSMTHAWKGALNRVDEIAARNKGDKFGAGWRAVTPEQERMMRVLTDPRAHLITTTRVKGEYERVGGGDGREKIKKVGMKADQRDGLEYEYDCVVRLDPEEHLAVVEKVRGCTAMDGRTGKSPGPDFWKPLFDWWLSADPVVTPEENARKQIAAATTLAELGEVWTALLPAVQAKLIADKDRRKAELSASPTRQPDPQLDVLRVELEDVLLEAGLSFADACRRHGAVVSSRLWGSELPSLADLDATELLRMIDVVRSGGDAGRQLFDGGEAVSNPTATVRH